MCEFAFDLGTTANMTLLLQGKGTFEDENIRQQPENMYNMLCTSMNNIKSHFSIEAPCDWLSSLSANNRGKDKNSYTSFFKLTDLATNHNCF